MVFDIIIMVNYYHKLLKIKNYFNNAQEFMYTHNW